MMSEWSISQRRVCRVLQLDPKSYRYKSRRPAQAVLEAKIKDDLKVTVRCIPLAGGEPGTCPFTGQPSKQRVVWAKSY